MTGSRLRARQQKVLSSVFQTGVSQPTPLLPATERGQPFGGPDDNKFTNEHLLHDAARSPQSSRSRLQARQDAERASSRGHIQVSDQVRWDRAWHVVTSRIQLPSSVSLEDSFGSVSNDSQFYDSGDFSESLALVLGPRLLLPRAAHTEDIVVWHTRQARQHFTQHVLPLLGACASHGSYEQIIQGTIQTLEAAHRQYLYGLSLILSGLDDQSGAAQLTATNFRRDLQALVGNSGLPGLKLALREALQQLLEIVLPSGQPHHAESGEQDEKDMAIRTARGGLLSLIENLNVVGLTGESFQILLAELMDHHMFSFIHQTYAGVWKASNVTVNVSRPSPKPFPNGCIDHLRDWVENRYARLLVEVLDRLGKRVAYADVERWRSTALERLATLRMNELYDIVLSWPHSATGLDDLKHAVATPRHRLQLTDTFSLCLQKQLLHPGMSTLHILKTYVSMIRTFHALDHSQVLLDKVVHALQLYLCQRPDAIRIVVTGLLTGPDQKDAQSRKHRLVELADILGRTSMQDKRHTSEDDVDWDDMSWVPAPVDAGVNYKRPKQEDVIGTLIQALGAQDIFIKEFQLIIAERLLSPTDEHLFPERMVLRLLKKRFGDSALQNSEVMIMDVLISGRLNANPGKSLQREGSKQPPPLHCKILSRLFWPSLPAETFKVPSPVAETQARYSANFEKLKASRKLTWLNQVGRAVVKLDLEDRSLELECRTYEAAVIYEFQSDQTSSAVPSERSFDELWETLTIDEDLLEAALKFWISKSVLREVGPKRFVVLERLNQDVGAPDVVTHTSSLTAATSDSQPPPPKPKGMNAQEREKRAMHWQFIVGMLTNSSPAMPLAQISMMMKMFISDGSSLNNEELQEFLGEKVIDQELELVGGKYRLPKK